MGCFCQQELLSQAAGLPWSPGTSPFFPVAAEQLGSEKGVNRGRALVLEEVGPHPGGPGVPSRSAFSMLIKK